jgi:deoxyadenosine/deoxycytidine kinase
MKSFYIEYLSCVEHQESPVKVCQVVLANDLKHLHRRLISDYIGNDFGQNHCSNFYSDVEKTYGKFYSAVERGQSVVTYICELNAKSSEKSYDEILAMFSSGNHPSGICVQLDLVGL